MSQTPIYDQLRRERINADVPAGAANPHQVGQAGQHRRSAGTRRHAPAGRHSPTARDTAQFSWFDLPG
ncbi:MAG: hypothetical protein WAK86_05380 [Pseudonocardiaceae bacterium]